MIHEMVNFFLGHSNEFELLTWWIPDKVPEVFSLDVKDSSIQRIEEIHVWMRRRILSDTRKEKKNGSYLERFV